jgi:hypothetical protein
VLIMAEDACRDVSIVGQAIDDLLALDPATLSDADLHDQVVALEREAARFTAARARLLVEWESRKAWVDDGCKSPRVRLSRDCKTAKATAGRDLRRARQLRHMPATAAAFAAGRLSVDYVDLLVNARTEPVAHLFARDEPVLLDQLARLSYPDAVQVVDHWRMMADQEADVKRRDRQRADRHAHADRTFGGGIHVSGFLPGLEGTIVLTELHRLERELFDADLAAARAQWGVDALAHLARTGRQRGADAIIEMAKRSAAMAPGSRLPAPLFSVLCGLDGLRAGLCQLEDGTVISPVELVPFLTDAYIERIVFDGPSRVIDVGERTRFFTGALRRAIQIRDRHCQHASGCDEPLDRCEVDHIHEYEDGGPTTQANGELECRYHNRWKHNHKHPPSRPPPAAA